MHVLNSRLASVFSLFERCICAHFRLALKNFEIRVGLDGIALANNATCPKQLESMAEGATLKSECREGLYGSWVSVNKTATEEQHEFLRQLMEVRVYESKYSARCAVVP